MRAESPDLGSLRLQQLAGKTCTVVGPVFSSNPFRESFRLADGPETHHIPARGLSQRYCQGQRLLLGKPISDSTMAFAVSVSGLAEELGICSITLRDPLSIRVAVLR
jgi:hypothetical protein